MDEFIIIAGPCAIESEELLLTAATELKKLNIKYLRGGAFKPRSTPDSFLGLEDKGIDILLKAKNQTNQKIVTEIMDTRDINLFKNIDVIQIGTRNSQNFKLLTEVGKTDKTILLKRGLANTIKEWINSAKYIEKEGNKNIIMCARGIRTFETEARNTSDIDAIPIIKSYGYKIIFDPSHSTGKKELILPMAKAAIAAGADGLMIEVHADPSKAKCDAKQQLTIKEFKEFLTEIKPYIDLRNK